MKKKIFSSMFFIAIVTAIVTALLATLIVYRDTREEMHEGTKMEAYYIIEAYYEVDEEGLRDFANITDSRVTVITPDGGVVFDSSADPVTMDNHRDRPEIIAAFEKGEGEDTRFSGTINQENYYYAVLLEDGNVFRISNRTGTIYSALLSMMPWIIAICLLAVAIALIFSTIQTADIVKPINRIDIDDPDEASVYPELNPLVKRLKVQRGQIKEQFDALEKQNNMRREFTANVSHELKTPLTSISGYAEIIKNGIAKPEDVSRFAGNIYNETQRLIALVGDILKLSHLDEGAEGMVTENIELSGLCRSVMARLSGVADERQVSLSLHGSEMYITGKRNLMEEMIYNLCDNGIKYNHPGGEVSIVLEHIGKGRRISVSDTGIGIPQKDLDRVFERFYRVDKSHSRETGGTGLGLSIVKHCVLLHGGTVSIDSHIDRGTTVTIDI